MSKLKIVIIDDNIGSNDPLIATLGIEMPDAEVVLKNNAQEGLDYVLENLSSKMIVLLDYDLGNANLNGTQILSEIREKTSLIYIIIITAKSIDQIPNESLRTYINKDALAFVEKTEDLKDRINLIKKASYSLDARVDSILEQWVNNHPEEEREQIYLKTSSKEYSLNDILQEIRQQTDFGKGLERKILLLAVDLLTRGKKDLPND